MLRRSIDIYIINFFRKVSEPAARFGLFVIFFWFGALKIFGLSPATPLVENLYYHTISFLNFQTFLVGFGFLECLIGLLFLIKGYERVVIPLLFVHMITTFMPLFVLPQATWSAFMVPTLEGQYIIKNLLVIAAAIGIASNLHPFRK